MKKLKEILVTILFLGVLIIPNVSSADIISDLQIQISTLLVQVQQLQEQLAQRTGQLMEKWCYTFNVDLKYGDSGNDVEALEIGLAKEGFFLNDNSGFFGEKIVSAVVDFQQKYKKEILDPWNLEYGTGFVGGTTRDKLNKLYGCGNVVLTETVKGVCGSANGQTFTSIPATNLCSVGTSTEVEYDDSDEDTYSWVCVAPQLNVNCYAYKSNSIQNQTPVIINISKPTSFDINHIGDWIIKAYDPDGTYLNYSVDWGDEDIIGESLSNIPAKSETASQSVIFSHSYSTAGNYIVIFKVVDEQGLSAKSSITVSVGGGVTTLKESKNLSNTRTCTDSDGPNNFYTKGITYGDLGGETKEWVDYCRNYDSVAEFTCRTNVYPDSDPLAVWYKSFKCPNGCEDGACIKARTCTDSDGPNNFYTKGITYGDFGGETKEWVDYCVTNDSVYDFTCKTNIYPDSNPLFVWAGSFKCPNGCEDGACIKEALKTCDGYNGSICNTNETCSGSWISTLDSDKCCDGNCELLKTCDGYNGSICNTNETCSRSWISASDSDKCCDGNCVVSNDNPEKCQANGYCSDAHYVCNENTGMCEIDTFELKCGIHSHIQGNKYLNGCICDYGWASRNGVDLEKEGCTINLKTDPNNCGEKGLKCSDQKNLINPDIEFTTCLDGNCRECNPGETTPWELMYSDEKAKSICARQNKVMINNTYEKNLICSDKAFWGNGRRGTLCGTCMIGWIYDSNWNWCVRECPTTSECSLSNERICKYELLGEWTGDKPHWYECGEAYYADTCPEAPYVWVPTNEVCTKEDII